MENGRADERAPRQRILAAASAIFAQQGFAGARVDDIASSAGVNKAMLYYHVGDKKALYTAVLMRNFDRVAAALEDARDHEGTVPERLDAVIHALFRALRDNPDHPKIVLREVASGGVSLPPEVLARMLEVVDLVRGLLQEGFDSGELRATEPVLTHLTIIGAVVFLTSIRPLLERARTLAPDHELPGPAVEPAPFVSDLMLHGLAAPSGGSS